jgi:hypothetical protein
MRTVRRLTFGGFLEAYVRYLSGENTTDLSRLVGLLAAEPRLVEPLLLWATVTGRSKRLTELLHDERDLLAELQILGSLMEHGHMEQALASEDPRLRPEYAKTWRSYVARRDIPARDARRKLEARERVLALEAQKHVSRYRVAKDLGLNPGNLHAFLSQGDPRKLTLEKVYRLVDYLEASDTRPQTPKGRTRHSQPGG